MSRVFAGVTLVAWYLVALVRSNVEVARAALRPHPDLSPVVIVVPARLHGWRLALWANMTTLTPGTLSVDVPHDESVLVVHTLWGQRLGAVRTEVEDLQERLMKVLA